MAGDETSTELLNTDDTGHMTFKVGARVQCFLGALQGVQGEIVAYRAGGRLLVKVATGMYLEVPRVCLKQEE